MGPSSSRELLMANRGRWAVGAGTCCCVIGFKVIYCYATISLIHCGSDIQGKAHSLARSARLVWQSQVINKIFNNNATNKRDTIEGILRHLYPAGE